MSLGGEPPNVQSVLLSVGSLVLLVYALRRARRLRRDESSQERSERPWNYRFGTTIRRGIAVLVIVYSVCMLGVLIEGGSGNALLLTAMILGVGLALIFVSGVALMAVVRLLTRRR